MTYLQTKLNTTKEFLEKIRKRFGSVKSIPIFVEMQL